MFCYYVFVRYETSHQQENEMNTQNHGHVMHEGKKLDLCQEAYLSNNSNALADNWYMAMAVGDDGEYMVYWDILESFLASDQEDETMACDWDSPVYIERLK